MKHETTERCKVVYVKKTMERNGFMLIPLTAVEEVEYGMGVKDIIGNGHIPDIFCLYAFEPGSISEEDQ